MARLLYKTPSHAANFFLERASEEQMPITQLKLIKMLYFAYGWVLAVLDERLFEEPIEAWKYGPVIPSIYHEFKRFGKEPIDCLSSYLDQENFGITTPGLKSCEKSTNVLEKFWDIHKHFSANDLVRISHQEGSPWDKHYKSDAIGLKIPDEDIRPYFRKKISGYLRI